MSHSRKGPLLTLVAGTTVSAGAPEQPKKVRPKKAPAAPLDTKIFAAGKTIEALLPAYVELLRTWAKGSSQAHAYCDANFSREERMAGEGPATAALYSIYESTGAGTADKAMGVLHRRMLRLADAIERSPAETIGGLQAKTLAAIFQCVSGIGGHSGFDFDNPNVLEMLFRACVRVTGLSELVTELKSKLE